MTKKMQILLSVIMAIILFLLSLFLILFFLNKKNEWSRNPEHIATVVKNTNLNKIFTKDKSKKIHQDEIIAFTKIANRDKKIHWEKISVDKKSISNNRASLISNDPWFYEGSVDVTYQEVGIIINLKSLFSHQDTFHLGKINLHPNEQITETKIINKINHLVPEVDMVHVTLQSLSSTKNEVWLHGDNWKYSGSVRLIFDVSQSLVKLEDIINKRDLEIIKTRLQDKPSEGQILDALVKHNPTIERRWIQVKFIHEKKATIQGTAHYEGTVDVFYQVDKRIELKEHLVNQRLGVIEISVEDVTAKNFVNALFSTIYLLNNQQDHLAHGIEIKDPASINLESTKAIVIGNMDANIYSGEVEIEFMFKVV